MSFARSRAALTSVANSAEVRRSPRSSQTTSATAAGRRSRIRSPSFSLASSGEIPRPLASRTSTTSSGQYRAARRVGVARTRVAARLRARLREAAGSAADPRPLRAVEEAYDDPARSVGDAYVALLRELLAPLGIPVLDASHAAVRNASDATLRAALHQ